MKVNINKKAIIFHNYGIGDFINMLPIVSYLSESYDMVLMVCLEKDRHNISKFLTFYKKLKIEYVKTKKHLIQYLT